MVSTSRNLAPGGRHLIWYRRGCAAKILNLKNGPLKYHEKHTLTDFFQETLPLQIFTKTSLTFSPLVPKELRIQVPRTKYLVIELVKKRKHLCHFLIICTFDHYKTHPYRLYSWNIYPYRYLEELKMQPLGASHNVSLKTQVPPLPRAFVVQPWRYWYNQWLQCYLSF